MIVFALGYLNYAIASILDYYVDSPQLITERGWLGIIGSAGDVTFGLLYTVVAWRVLSAARRTWGSWRSAAGVDDEPTPIESP
jgi:hypothetical protein